MAEILNEYFSSVFTTEDTRSFLAPVTKYEGDKSDHLGQLFVTPEMIAKKIKKMKDNKSPGVDEIHESQTKNMITLYPPRFLHRIHKNYKNVISGPGKTGNPEKNRKNLIPV